MIDIHCHILPGLDHGAKHLEESVAMAKEAVNQGVDTIIATPQHQHSFNLNTKEDILFKVDMLNERLKAEKVNLAVLPGQTIKLHGEMLDYLSKGYLLELNEQTGYLLIELPIDHIPKYISQIFYDLQLQGYKPIIVHPEQHKQFKSDPSYLYELVKRGALVQLATSSLVGKHGKRAQKLSFRLVDTNQAHFIGSEAHNQDSYTFKQALDKVRKKFGEETVYYFLENAQCLSSGEAALVEKPVRIKTKKLLGLL